VVAAAGPRNRAQHLRQAGSVHHQRVVPARAAPGGSTHT
jgi:hypothetical protein